MKRQHKCVIITDDVLYIMGGPLKLYYKLLIILVVFVSYSCYGVDFKENFPQDELSTSLKIYNYLNIAPIEEIFLQSSLRSKNKNAHIYLYTTLLDHIMNLDSKNIKKYLYTIGADSVYSSTVQDYNVTIVHYKDNVMFFITNKIDQSLNSTLQQVWSRKGKDINDKSLLRYIYSYINKYMDINNGKLHFVSYGFSSIVTQKIAKYMDEYRLGSKANLVLFSPIINPALKENDYLSLMYIINRKTILTFINNPKNVNLYTVSFDKIEYQPISKTANLRFRTLSALRLQIAFKKSMASKTKNRKNANSLTNKMQERNYSIKYYSSSLINLMTSNKKVSKI